MKVYTLPADRNLQAVFMHVWKVRAKDMMRLIESNMPQCGIQAEMLEPIQDDIREAYRALLKLASKAEDKQLELVSGAIKEVEE